MPRSLARPDPRSNDLPVFAIFGGRNMSPAYDVTEFPAGASRYKRYKIAFPRYVDDTARPHNARGDGEYEETESEAAGTCRPGAKNQQAGKASACGWPRDIRRRALCARAQIHR